MSDYKSDQLSRSPILGAASVLKTKGSTHKARHPSENFRFYTVYIIHRSSRIVKTFSCGLIKSERNQIRPDLL